MNKLVYRLLFSFWILTATSSFLAAQKVTYAEPDHEDFRQMRFEILGKMKGNFLVYKNYRSSHYITVYDNDMKQKSKE
ncbi:MAG: hypothetical protein ACM3H8_03880, partial [Sphingobacteriales bacterium]